MEAAPIGVGSKKTLHGTPDMKADDLLCLYMPCASEDEEEEVEEGDDEISSGLGSGSTGKDEILYPYIVSLQFVVVESTAENWTYLEGKSKIQLDHFNKLIATSITSSFTQRNALRREMSEYACSGCSDSP